MDNAMALNASSAIGQSAGGSNLAKSTAPIIESGIARKATEEQLQRLYVKRDNLANEMTYVAREIAAFEASHVALSKIVDAPTESPPQFPRVC